jgi:hypothetical protein
MTLDLTKPVQTRDGRPARIICTDRVGNFPVVALVPRKDGIEHINVYTCDGRASLRCNAHSDLIPVPQRHMVWCNVYAEDPDLELHLGLHPAPYLSAHISEDEANRMARDSRLACIRIEFEEGEGLDADES